MAKKRTTKNNTLAKKVAKLEKTVRFRAPETKHVDDNANGAVIDNNPSWFISPARAISLGEADFSERIGDKVTLKHLQFRGNFYKVVSVSNVPTRVRLIAFIYKKNPDQVVSTWSTIVNLYLTSGGMNSLQAPMTFKEWDNHGSFKTLYDKTYIINHDTAADKMVKCDFGITIPKAYSKVSFNVSSQAPTENELFVCAIQSADTGLLLDFQYRLTYIDP